MCIRDNLVFYVIDLTAFHVILHHLICTRQMVPRTVVRAEDRNYEAEFNKLQKEAEERLDEKVAELMKNIDTVGQK